MHEREKQQPAEQAEAEEEEEERSPKREEDVEVEQQQHAEQGEVEEVEEREGEKDEGSPKRKGGAQKGMKYRPRVDFGVRAFDMKRQRNWHFQCFDCKQMFRTHASWSRHRKGWCSAVGFRGLNSGFSRKSTRLNLDVEVEPKETEVYLCACGKKFDSVRGLGLG